MRGAILEAPNLPLELVVSGTQTECTKQMTG
jgi:hypothetical protein